MSKESSPQDSSILEIFNALIKLVGDKNQESMPSTSLLDTSLTAAKNFFERQAIGGLSLISPHESVDDFIAIKGKEIQLTAVMGLAQALAGVKVHFFVDQKKIDDVSIGPELKARTKYIPKKSGCFSLAYRIFSKTGVEIFDARKQNNVVLQVLDTSPVICVDAELLKNKKSKLDQHLSILSSEGFDIVYLDFGKLDRTEELRTLLHNRQLPSGAIISLTARIKQFESFNVDFKQSFLGLAINRLRADGAPLVAIISDFKVNNEFYFPKISVFKESDSIEKSQLRKIRKLTKEFLLNRNNYWGNHSASIEWRINEMVLGEWYNNNRCKVEMNNKFARQEIFKEIEAAEKQIDLQFYIFKDSRFAQELGVALARAASRGVQVRLMVDALWSGENFLGSWNSFLKRIGKTKRIHIVAADSLSLRDEWDMSSLRQRDHRKLILIDQKVAFVGGRNGADEYYFDWSEVPIADWTIAENIPWLDAHVQVRGSVVNEVQNLFDKTWKRSGGKGVYAKDKKSGNKKIKSTKNNLSTDTGESRVRLVVHEGTRDANGLAAYEALICGAKKKLILVNDFPVLDDVAEMLIQAVNRGVKVSFLTGSVLARRIDGSFFEGGRHRELFEYVVKSRLGVLADAGVCVYEFQTEELSNIAVRGGRIRPYVHAKLITADNRYASIGSANLDITASYWEREANLLIDDVKVIRSLNRKLESMIKRGIKLDTSSTEWKREMPQREVVARLWPNTFLT